MEYLNQHNNGDYQVHKEGAFRHSLGRTQHSSGEKDLDPRLFLYSFFHEISELVNLVTLYRKLLDPIRL